MTDDDEATDDEAAADVLLAGESIIGSVKEIRDLAMKCGLDALVEQLAGKPEHFFAVIEGRECKGFLLPVDENGRVKWQPGS